VSAKEPPISFQSTLNKLEAVINPWTSLYLIMRRKGSPIAITFVPYLAKETERGFFLAHRLDLVQQLGEANFSQSLICKEVGEITDARSWDERDEWNENSTLGVSTVKLEHQERICDDKDCKDVHVEDLGYRRNKCRLCDRRMKNEITPEALATLATLSSPGAVVQIVSFFISQALNYCY
jgi:twinfilin-like protein